MSDFRDSLFKNRVNLTEDSLKDALDSFFKKRELTFDEKINYVLSTLPESTIIRLIEEYGEEGLRTMCAIQYAAHEGHISSSAIASWPVKINKDK